MAAVGRAESMIELPPLLPPAWMRKVVFVSAFSAAGAVIQLLAAMLYFDWARGRLFEAASAAISERLASWPAPAQLWLRWPVLVACGLGVLAVVQCTRPGRRPRPAGGGERLFPVASCHGAMALTISWMFLADFIRSGNVIGYAEFPEQHFTALMRTAAATLPAAALVALSLALLRGRIGDYFFGCGWVLQVGLIGVASVAFDIACMVFLELAVPMRTSA